MASRQGRAPDFPGGYLAPHDLPPNVRRVYRLNTIDPNIEATVRSLSHCTLQFDDAFKHFSVI